MTQASEIYDSFESTFCEKRIIPDDLKKVWLLKAIGEYGLKIDKLVFDKENDEFDCELDRDIIDILGLMMKKFYQERQVSLVNKRVSINTKDLSYDSGNGVKTAERAHLEFIKEELETLIDNKKETSYN